MKNVLLSRPSDCYIILTDKCNMRCRHCYGRYGYFTPEKELNGNEWCDIIDDLAKQNIFFLNISGGEPTVHPDFDQIIDCIIKNNMLFILTTNGIFSKNILNKILETKNQCLGIKISLDGPDCKSYNYLRRDVNNRENDNFFPIVLQNIEILTKNGFPITIATCLHPNNINLLDEMKHLILKIKPVNWFISTISLSGSADINNEIFVSESKLPKEYWLDLKKECEDNGVSISFVDMPTLQKSSAHKDIYFNCPAARSFCEIYSDGTVSPCPLARVNIPRDDIQFDNIKNKDLTQIWKSRPFKKFRSLQHHGCKGCKARKKCDRCIPQSYQWFKNPNVPPPYCIQNAESLKLYNGEKLQELLNEKLKQKNRESYL